MSTATIAAQAPARDSTRLCSLWPRRLPAVMGVLNCTPDSFSDGGRFTESRTAVERGLVMASDGAAIIDVGGESTRPGAAEVSVEEELSRVLPVIRELGRRQPSVLLSVDTSKADVAAAALAEGADIVNDVSSGSDPLMLETVARAEAAIVLMHMRGTPRTMQLDTGYVDVVAEVHHELLDRAEAATKAGIPTDHVWLDPGIGFGKDDDANVKLLAALPDLAAHGFPVVLGPSRKSFIGRLTGAGVDDRLPGTLAALLPAIGLQRAVVRVHDPAEALQFLVIATAIMESRS